MTTYSRRKRITRNSAITSSNSSKRFIYNEETVLFLYLHKILRGQKFSKFLHYRWNFCYWSSKSFYYFEHTPVPRKGPEFVIKVNKIYLFPEKPIKISFETLDITILFILPANKVLSFTLQFYNVRKFANQARSSWSSEYLCLIHSIIGLAHRKLLFQKFF